MGVVFDFFGEEVAGVDDARDVCDFDCVVLMIFANTIFVEINMFGAFECNGGCPITSGFVVVVYCDAFGGVGKAEVDGTMFDAEEVIDTFVSSVDFSDAGAVCRLLLSNSFPGDGATGTTDKVT